MGQLKVLQYSFAFSCVFMEERVIIKVGDVGPYHTAMH